MTGVTKKPSDDDNGYRVRPDSQTKTIGGIALVVMLGVMFWIGSSTASQGERLAKLEGRFDALVTTMNDIRQELRELRQEIKEK